MIRGFLSGVIWGTIVSALGLGAVSQLTPLPVARIAADASAVPRAKAAPVVPVPVVPEPVLPVPVAPEPAKSGAEVAVPEAVVPQAPVSEVVVPEVVVPVAPVPDAPLPDAASPALGAPKTDATDAVAPTVGGADAETAQTPAAGAPASPVTAALDPPAGSEFAKPLPDTDPVLPGVDLAPVPDVAVAPVVPPTLADDSRVADATPVAPITGLDAPTPIVAPDETGLDNPTRLADEGGKPAVTVPGQVALPQADASPAPTPSPPPAVVKPAAPEPTPLPNILLLPESPPETQAEPPLTLTPDPVLVPDTDPEVQTGGKSSATLAPTPGLAGKVAGVTVGRLPRIGDPAPATDAAPNASTDGTAPATDAADNDAELPPLQKYAREFENPDAKPLFSIILIDTGGDDLDRASLAAMPFPVTFALDPMAPNVAEAARIYRAAGQEVIMVATGIPTGATAADLEVTFQANAAALPEAVAVIDTEFGAFQADRPLATQVVPILKAQGRGLISWDRGLNAADQVARREGVPSGMVFRKLDGKGENTAAVRRALDRAAFKAAQDGRVMVIGQTLPDTVAALMAWAVEGRAASVALAPVSAALTVE